MCLPSLLLACALLPFVHSSSSSLRGETSDPPADLPREVYGRSLGPISVDLSTYLPIRIVVTLVGVTTNPTVTDMLKNDLIPAVVLWYSKALGVHRYLGTVAVWGLPGDMCNGIPIPAADKYPGYTGDLIIYINTTGTGTMTIGTQDVCLTDSVRGNPLAAGFILNKAFLESAQWIDIYRGLMYLFGQSLGFGSNLYRNARKNGWTLYSDAEMFRTDLDDFNNTIRYLITPTVLSRASQSFLSRTLGVPITNKAGVIEFSYRALMYDLWSDGPVNMRIAPTLISLAFFADLGWYSVNFSMGATPVIGYGMPSFLDTRCVDGNGVPGSSHFCSGSSPMCDVSLLNKAVCSQLNGNASCPVAVDLGGGSCLNPNNYILGTELEEFCPECRCFVGTHTLGFSAVSSRPICHRVVCTASNAKVRIGDALVDCPTLGGVIRVQNVTGTVTCPPFSQLCPTYGCPKDCSGAGLCQQGKCVCDSGYFGDDCSSKTPPGVKTLTPGILCTTNSTYNTVTKKCDCNVGSYYDYITKTCINCNTYCTTCGYVPDLCLSCPPSSNSALVGPAGTACSCNWGFFRNSLSGKCESCDERCDSCILGAGNCLTCKATYVFQPNGQCLCPPGTYQDTTVNPKVCRTCAAGCDTCSSSTVCTTCLATFIFSAGQCKCQTGQYVDTVSKQCRSCHPSCVECSTAANVCTKCATNFAVDPIYKICTYAGFTRVSSWKFPLSSWMSSDALFFFECMKGNAARDFCKPLDRRGIWFDSSPGYYLFTPNKLSSTPVILPSTFQFSLWVRPDSSRNDRCMLSKTKVGAPETQVLTFCVSPTNTVYLAARMRSLDLATLGNEISTRIDTVISILYDKWAALKFRFDAAIDYMGRPGTLVTILIDTMVYQQTFFPTMMFEDILDGSDQRFVLGAQWLWGAARNPFFGYMGEMAILPASIVYPGIPACGCPKCGGYSTCLSDCGITETDTVTGTCANNQT